MRSTTAWVLTASLLLAGCSRDEPADSTGEAPDANGPVADGEDYPPWHGELTLNVLSWPETQELILEHEGQVVVVNLWAAWCPPCQREFPRFVNLQRKYGEEIACIGVNINAGFDEEPPEELATEVRDFLEQHDARFQNVICSTPDEQIYEELGLSYYPAVLVYDRDGQLHEVVTQDDDQYETAAGFELMEQVDPIVSRLLKAE